MKNINVRVAALTAALVFALASQAGAQSMYVCLYYAPLQKQFASSLKLYQGVVVSDDRGESWEQIFWETSRANDICFDPREDDRSYLATDYGCFVSDDAGESWKLLTPMHMGTVFNVLLLDSQIWIATPKGPYTSDDGGDTWEARTTGLPSLNAQYTSDIIAVEEEVLAGKRTMLYIATANGVYSSVDGRKWEPAGLQGHSIDNIFSSPASPELLAATSVLEGIWLRGKDFKWSFKAEELYSKKVQSVAFHPSDPETIYIGFRDFPVCKTTDGGAEWKTVNAGLTNNNVTALAFDPEDANIVYAGTENGTFITRNAGDRWEQFSLRFGFVRSIRFKEEQQ